MDLGLKDVHVLVTGMYCLILRVFLLKILGASGGIGLETVKLFLGKFSILLPNVNS